MSDLGLVPMNFPTKIGGSPEKKYGSAEKACFFAIK